MVLSGSYKEEPDGSFSFIWVATIRGVVYHLILENIHYTIVKDRISIEYDLSVVSGDKEIPKEDSQWKDFVEVADKVLFEMGEIDDF